MKASVPLLSACHIPSTITKHNRQQKDKNKQITTTPVALVQSLLLEGGGGTSFPELHELFHIPLLSCYLPFYLLFL